VSVPAQIAVLLALTAELFDRVPLDQMTDAEHALREAAAEIPAEVRERLDTAKKLRDEDRATIIQIARKSLARFQPKPEPESKPEVQTEVKHKPKAEAKAEPKAEAKAEPKPEVKAESKPEPKEKS
jgi:F-type H+-transporting ATPase subunit alpha